jgi:Ca-activated chloride channel family protein
MNPNDPQALLRDAAGQALALQGVTVEMAVRDLAVEVCAVQRYRNPRDTNVEVVYTFPLPAEAVLLDLEVSLGERVLKGTVVEKKAAEHDYEQAIAEGHTAILLQEAGEGLYTLNLGNLMAGEQAAVKLRYAWLARWSADTVRLLLPCAIAPRYGDALAAGLQPHQVPEASLAAEYPLEITVRVEGLLARARVACPSHPVAVQAQDGALTLKLARKGFLDRDFVLDFELAAASADAARLAPDGAGVVALASFRPQPPAGHAPGALALKLVVDCSGSMAGDSIAQAKAALAEILGLLEPRDRFDLTVFGSHFRHLFPALVPASPANLAQARRFVEATDADLGGTEMAAALNAAFALPADTQAADLLLITDGEISEAEALIGKAAKARQRVFVVGVGSAVSESFLRRLASATGGACELVAPREGIAARIVAQFRRMRAPRATLARIRWPAEPDWATPLPQSLFAGDTVHLFAGFTAPVQGEVRLELGYAGGSVHAQTVSLEPAAPDFAPELPRLAAARRLTDLDETEGLRLALAHRLVSPWTHTLMIAERGAGEQAQELPELHVVPQMLAAGWGGVGRVDQADLSCALAMADMDLPAPPRIKSRAFWAADQLEMSREIIAQPVPLTPVGLVSWLNGRCGRLYARARAPQILAALQGGLPAEVVAWLESVVRAGWDEAAVVATFLQALADGPAGAALTRNARRAVLKAVADAKPAAALLDFFGRALARASGEDWGPFAAAAVPGVARQGA